MVKASQSGKTTLSNGNAPIVAPLSRMTPITYMEILIVSGNHPYGKKNLITVNVGPQK
jgi:hypothetical protein